MPDTGYRMPDTGCRMPDSYISAFKVQSSGFRVQISDFILCFFKNFNLFLRYNQKHMRKTIIPILFAFLLPWLAAGQDDSAGHTTLIYKFEIKEQIAPPAVRTTQRAFKEAAEAGADIMLLHMNTYGGLVDAADSIRTRILNSDIPVYVFIDNNAASAGALIAIACDSIYMSPVASMGAATVVDQSGQPVPDKYQSYMRSWMRATAEANGRDPDIAQAMVDPDIYIAGSSIPARCSPSLQAKPSGLAFARVAWKTSLNWWKMQVYGNTRSSSISRPAPTRSSDG